MLKAVKRTKTRHPGGTFAIVASKYNARYVDAMLRAARKCLDDAGAEKILRVHSSHDLWIGSDFNPIGSVSTPKCGGFNLLVAISERLREQTLKGLAVWGENCSC